MTDDRILEIAHRKASTYAHRSDPKYHSYGFVRHTMLDFARAILAEQAALPVVPCEPHKTRCNRCGNDVFKCPMYQAAALAPQGVPEHE